MAFAGALDQLKDASTNAPGTIDGTTPKPTGVESAPGRGNTQNDPRKNLRDKREMERAEESEKAAKEPPPTSTGTVVTPPAEPAKPTLLEKMGKDLNDNKTNYAIAGATGALTGYFLAGCVLSGALLGFGIIVLFLMLYRNIE